MHASHFNHRYMDYGGTRVPEGAGDRYWSQDLAGDMRYLQSLPVRAILALLGTESALLSGGAVSQGSSVTQANISAAVGVASMDVEVIDGSAAWSVPPAHDTDTIKAMAACPSLVDVDLSGGTLDGSTVNYVKLRPSESPSVETRAREFSSGSYPFLVSESYAMVCDAVAPTEYDVLLATYVGNGTDTLTITQIVPAVGPAATPGAILRLDSNGRAKVSSPSAPSDIANKESVDGVLNSESQSAGNFDRSEDDPIHDDRINYDGTLYATEIVGLIRVPTSTPPAVSDGNIWVE